MYFHLARPPVPCPETAVAAGRWMFLSADVRGADFRDVPSFRRSGTAHTHVNIICAHRTHISACACVRTTIAPAPNRVLVVDA